MHASAAPTAASGVGRWIPVLGWLRGDLLASITLAAYLLPAALGDASLARLNPEAGLYACLFGGLVFWLFCSSRHTSITVTSAISLLVAFIAFIAWLVKAGAAPGWETVNNGVTWPRLIQIHSSKDTPKDAFVAIPYRGNWFWIDDRDLKSKRTFTFMMLLFTLADTGEKEPLPLITIPAIGFSMQTKQTNRNQCPR